MPDIILVSGGFDPIHSGHIKLINDANKYGDVAVSYTHLRAHET